MAIKITYTIDSPKWDNNQFEDQETKYFIITDSMIKSLMMGIGAIRKDEFIHDIEDVKIY